jgi:hypothetical protein
LRTGIGIAVLIVAAALIADALWGTLPTRMSDLFLNLGSELMGIVLTVGIIDYLLERRRSLDEAKRIALEALHDLDHHMWVWQGGARGFDLAELTALVAEVNDSDPVPEFTQSLFLVLGSRANNTLRTKPEVLRRSPLLSQALAVLSRLTAMRDGDAHIASRDIASCLAAAIPDLIFVAGLSQPVPISLAPGEFRQTSVEAQEWRHYGRRRNGA